MLACLRTGHNPGKPTYITSKEFEERYTLVKAGRRIPLQTEAIWWAYNGRLGSRCIIADELYIKVKEEGDDPSRYYTPEKPPRYAPMPMSGGSSCCGTGSSDGNCSDCGSGCGGNCP